jgi:hypothetical protein
LSLKKTKGESVYSFAVFFAEIGDREQRSLFFYLEAGPFSFHKRSDRAYVNNMTIFKSYPQYNLSLALNVRCL